MLQADSGSASLGSNPSPPAKLFNKSCQTIGVYRDHLSRYETAAIIGAEGWWVDRFMDMNNASSPRMPEIKNLAPTSSAGHAAAGANADVKLAFHPDHQAGPVKRGR